MVVYLIWESQSPHLGFLTAQWLGSKSECPRRTRGVVPCRYDLPWKPRWPQPSLALSQQLSLSCPLACFSFPAVASSSACLGGRHGPETAHH